MHIYLDIYIYTYTRKHGKFWNIRQCFHFDIHQIIINKWCYISDCEDKGLKPPIEEHGEVFNPFLPENKDPRVMKVRDVRPEISKWTTTDALDNHGFMYVKNKSSLSTMDYYDNEIVMNEYYPASWRACKRNELVLQKF